MLPPSARDVPLFNGPRIRMVLIRWHLGHLKGSLGGLVHDSLCKRCTCTWTPWVIKRQTQEGARSKSKEVRAVAMAAHIPSLGPYFKCHLAKEYKDNSKSPDAAKAATRNC